MNTKIKTYELIIKVLLKERDKIKEKINKLNNNKKSVVIKGYECFTYNDIQDLYGSGLITMLQFENSEKKLNELNNEVKINELKEMLFYINEVIHSIKGLINEIKELPN